MDILRLTRLRNLFSKFGGCVAGLVAKLAHTFEAHFAVDSHEYVLLCLLKISPRSIPDSKETIILSD